MQFRARFSSSFLLRRELETASESTNTTTRSAASRPLPALSCHSSPMCLHMILVALKFLGDWPGLTTQGTRWLLHTLLAPRSIEGHVVEGSARFEKRHVVLHHLLSTVPWRLQLRPCQQSLCTSCAHQAKPKPNAPSNNVQETLVRIARGNSLINFNIT